jgi:hypothetical protein
VEAQRGTRRETWATYAVCTRAWRRFLNYEERFFPSVGVFLRRNGAKNKPTLDYYEFEYGARIESAL